MLILYIEFHREMKYGFLLSEEHSYCWFKSWEENNNKTLLYTDSTDKDSSVILVIFSS